MNSSSFYIILKNKYLFQEILKYCKVDDGDLVSYKYYDIPLGYLCKRKLWKIFDDRLNKYINIINNNKTESLYNNRHLLLDFSRQDIFEFFTNNKSYSRFLNVWNSPLSKAIIHHYYLIDHGQMNILELAIQAKADLEIIDHLYKINRLSNINLFVYLKSIAKSGCLETFDYFFKKKVEAHSGDIYQTSILAAQSKNYQLSKILVDFSQHTTSVIFEINKYPLEIIEYLFEKQIDQSRFKLERLPPDHQDSIEFIIDCNLQFKKNPNTSTHLAQLDFYSAASIGNIKLLKYMKHILYSKDRVFRDRNLPKPFDWSSSKTIDTLDFFLDDFPEIDWDITKFAMECQDLDLLRHLVEKRDSKSKLRFSCDIWEAPFNVIEYLLSVNYFLPPYRDVSLVNFANTKDIRVLELIYERYPMALTNLSLQRCISSQNIQGVDFLLSKSIGEISSFSFEHCLSKCDYEMYNLLKNYLFSTNASKFHHIKSQLYFWIQNQLELILKIVVNSDYKCIEIIQDINRSTILSILSDHYIKAIGSYDSLKKPKMHQTLFNNVPLVLHKTKIIKLLQSSISNCSFALTKQLIPILQTLYGKDDFIMDDSIFLHTSVTDKSLFEIAPYITDTLALTLIDRRFPSLVNYQVLNSQTSTKRNQFIINLLQQAKRNNNFNAINILAEINVKIQNPQDLNLMIQSQIDRNQTTTYNNTSSSKISNQLNSNALLYLKENSLMDALYPFQASLTKNLFEF